MAHSHKKESPIGSFTNRTALLSTTPGTSDYRSISGKSVAEENDGFRVGSYVGGSSQHHSFLEGDIASSPGAFISRDLYKAHDDYINNGKLVRSRSIDDLQSLKTESVMEEFRSPLGFRQHFIRNRAQLSGKAPPNLVTRTWMDYLDLYGHFAGEELESEDEDDYYTRVDSDLEDNESGEIHPDDSQYGPGAEEHGHEPGSNVGTASVGKSFFLLLKSFIGTGVLFLPKAFYNGGLLFSTLFLIFIAVLTSICMLLLIKVHDKIPGSFGEIGGILFGSKMRISVLVSIILSQVGFVCAYFIFVAQNIRDLLLAISDCAIDIPQHYFIALQLFIYIPFAWMRKIKSLSSAALIANMLILFGIGYIYYIDTNRLATLGLANVQMFNPKDFPLFIGTALFTFEGIGLVIPIVNAMKEPEKFPRMMITAMAVMTVLFVSVGALSYSAFGDEIQTVVLLNMPYKHPVTESVQVFYVTAIVLTVPLMLFPVTRIIEQWVFGARTGKYSFKVKWQKNLSRSIICIILALIAWGGASNLDNFVALIGAFACIPLVFIYPAMYHLKAVATHRLVRLGDLLLIVFGIIVMFYVTYTTITGWTTAHEIDRCPGKH
ncbi:hypothetical protein K493DRAFT_255673 [Basidiobolus meristosporus CBS 931.73]|uniref:Amino acid transporter transmembrane domain-containing protein n=1 Tax=Basidiobolus meristosporus CBS 931.73 TaxID=1314790 RepID=A0A1Y1YU87_9FUNG|nr:hypothetical protein K493DRAFT_255673 [Basidiobolus meristosporus CBS 931.73]|eukprot:ORY01394.1 hypothetical protein K493DRAFT_255673 [Basidiobolus meristosporus CBS 931.73]